MSKEKGKETTSQSSEHQETSEQTTQAVEQQQSQQQQQQSQQQHLPSFEGHQSTQSITPQFSALPAALGSETDPQQHAESGERKPAAETASQSTDEAAVRPRQVIAVSASKGPAAFFNLARKFLVTDEMCDLSALEGAIVSAVDAAHLLERSKLATIVRIQTSYVTVEPKRRKSSAAQGSAAAAGRGGSTSSPVEGIQGYHGGASPGSPPPTETQTRRTSSGRELRRARIVITVRRTESYKKWLEENPLQAIIAGDAEDEAAEAADETTS